MIDYNSIIPEDKIDRLIIERLKEYDKHYIYNLINELRRLEILSLQNSIYGWNNFISDYICNLIRKITLKRIYIAKQKLAFIRSFESLKLNDYQIAELSCEKIDPSIIIHN